MRLPGTLLSPEGSSLCARHSLLGHPPPNDLLLHERVRGDRGNAVRPYLENCTVDASIFVATSYLVRMVDA